MRKIALIICFLAAVLCAHAQTIILRTGARVKGTILFENEEVVIVRTDEGARFQYPKTDVEAVLSDEEAVKANGEGANGEGTNDEGIAPEITTPKKASILVEVAGGAAIQPGEAVGGDFDMEPKIIISAAGMCLSAAVWDTTVYSSVRLSIIFCLFRQRCGCR